MVNPPEGAVPHQPEQLLQMHPSMMVERATRVSEVIEAGFGWKAEPLQSGPQVAPEYVPLVDGLPFYAPEDKVVASDRDTGITPNDPVGLQGVANEAWQMY